MKKILLLFMLISIITKAQSRHQNKTNDKEKKNTIDNTLGNNIVTFSPIGITMANTNQELPDMSVGISYEHITKNGYIGFKLPVVASLYNPYYYFMPGIKLYPGKQGNAKYAIGPQLLWSTGKVKVAESYDSFTGSYKVVSKQRSQFGFMINNSFNFTIARHLYVGLDLGLGIIYYDNQPNAIYNSNSTFFSPSNNNGSSINPCTHLSFGMGYRF